MDKTYLPDLISGLEKELLRLGYTKGSMTFYRRRWNQLMAYAEDRNECYYTEQLGIDFLKEFFGITQEDFSKTLPQAETQEIRVIRMVGDFQLHHAVLRRYLKHKEILTAPFFADIRIRFHSFCGEKRYSRVTTEHYVKQSSYLMDYLAAQGMDDFTAVTLDTVNAYIRTLAGFSYKTVEQHICSPRAFVVIDYVTGVMCAVADRNLSSEMGFRGIAKKVLVFLLVGVANILDVHVIGNGSVLRTAVIFFYISNEGVSLLENASRLGLPIPEKMKAVLKQLHERSGSSTDDEEGGGV